MRSYLEVITELADTVESDNIPEKDKAEINLHIQQLMGLLLKYSD